jgi:metal-responsive CopG/Arc/MetJ family transcriptional regulator
MNKGQSKRRRRLVRLHLSVPESFVAAIDGYAKERGLVSRSEAIRQCMSQLVGGNKVDPSIKVRT